MCALLECSSILGGNSSAPFLRAPQLTADALLLWVSPITKLSVARPFPPTLDMVLAADRAPATTRQPGRWVEKQHCLCSSPTLSFP